MKDSRNKRSDRALREAFLETKHDDRVIRAVAFWLFLAVLAGLGTLAWVVMF